MSHNGLFEIDIENRRITIIRLCTWQDIYDEYVETWNRMEFLSIESPMYSGLEPVEVDGERLLRSIIIMQNQWEVTDPRGHISERHITAGVPAPVRVPDVSRIKRQIWV